MTVEIAAPVTPKRKVYISKGNKNTAAKFPIPANQSPTAIDKIEKQKVIR